MTEKDYDGVAPAEVIGKRFVPHDETYFTPAGIIVDAYVDGNRIMMMTVVTDVGSEMDLVPLTMGRAT